MKEVRQIVYEAENGTQVPVKLRDDVPPGEVWLSNLGKEYRFVLEDFVFKPFVLKRFLFNPRPNKVPEPLPKKDSLDEVNEKKIRLITSRLKNLEFVVHHYFIAQGTEYSVNNRGTGHEKWIKETFEDFSRRLVRDLEETA
jgi:hypothetical protein